MFFTKRTSIWLCGFFLACVGQQRLWADSVDVYTNEAAWQNAASDSGANPLASVNFSASAWKETHSGPPGDTITDTSTASNGMSIVLQNSAFFEAFAPIFLNDNSAEINVSVLDGNEFEFGKDVYAFGAYFTLPSCDPKLLEPCLVIDTIVPPFFGPAEDGFWGFVSSVPTSSFYLTGQCTPSATNCGGYVTISSLQLSTIPTPEPSYSFISIVGIFSLAMLRKIQTKPVIELVGARLGGLKRSVAEIFLQNRRLLN